jgi:hypothetical protein
MIIFCITDAKNNLEGNHLINSFYLPCSTILSKVLDVVQQFALLIETVPKK